MGLRFFGLFLLGNLCHDRVLGQAKWSRTRASLFGAVSSPEQTLLEPSYGKTQRDFLTSLYVQSSSFDDQESTSARSGSMNSGDASSAYVYDVQRVTADVKSSSPFEPGPADMSHSLSEPYGSEQKSSRDDSLPFMARKASSNGGSSASSVAESIEFGYDSSFPKNEDRLRPTYKKAIFDVAYMLLGIAWGMEAYRAWGLRRIRKVVTGSDKIQAPYDEEVINEFEREADKAGILFHEMGLLHNSGNFFTKPGSDSSSAGKRPSPVRDNEEMQLSRKALRQRRLKDETKADMYEHQSSAMLMEEKARNALVPRSSHVNE